MLDRFFKARQARMDAVSRAREEYSSWRDIANSKGWQAYAQKIDEKIENIRHKIENDMTLTGEDLKRLQLALQVWNEVKKIPKKLEGDAKAGGK